MPSRALRERRGAQIRNFEEVFEPLGLTALAIQVLTGLGMGWIDWPGYQGLLSRGIAGASGCGHDDSPPVTHGWMTAMLPVADSGFTLDQQE